MTLTTKRRERCAAPRRLRGRNARIAPLLTAALLSAPTGARAADREALRPIADALRNPQLIQVNPVMAGGHQLNAALLQRELVNTLTDPDGPPVHRTYATLLHRALDTERLRIGLMGESAFGETADGSLSWYERLVKAGVDRHGSPIWKAMGVAEMAIHPRPSLAGYGKVPPGELREAYRSLVAHEGAHYLVARSNYRWLLARGHTAAEASATLQASGLYSYAEEFLAQRRGWMALGYGRRRASVAAWWALNAPLSIWRPYASLARTQGMTLREARRYLAANPGGRGATWTGFRPTRAAGWAAFGALLVRGLWGLF